MWRQALDRVAGFDSGGPLSSDIEAGPAAGGVADEAGESADGDTALRLVFAARAACDLLRRETPEADAFVAGVLAATRGARRAAVTAGVPVPSADHGGFVTWPRVWIAAAIVGGAVLLGIWAALGDGLSVPAPDGVVGAALELWSAAVALGVVIERAIVRPAVAGGLALAAGLGGGSLSVLVRMLSSEGEASTWTQSSSIG